MDRILLTPNGKIDRRAATALLEPDAVEVSGGAPRDDVEAALANIVAAVLGVDVGVYDDFFSLGGDSVLATTAVARMRDWLEVDHAVVADLFAARMSDDEVLAQG
jgi:mycobactin phenyloxazoline synthetase